MPTADAAAAAPPADGGAAARPRRGTGRQALLDAGLQALQQMTAEQLVAGLGVRELSRRAGLTSAAFYHHFPSAKEYAEALLAQLYRFHGFTPAEERVEDLSDLRRAAMPVEQSMAYHRRDLGRTAEDPGIRTRLGVWALGGAAADAAFGGFLDAVDGAYAVPTGALIESWGREVRPPLDLTAFVRMHTALYSGGSTRFSIDPNRLSSQAYERVGTTLSFLLLRLQGDRHTIDDRLAEFNQRGVDRPVLPGRVRRPVATRSRILEAAHELFGAVGYDATTVAAVAERAGTASDTVYAHFATKARLAAELVLHDADADPVLGVDGGAAEAGLDPLEGLRRHLVALADFAAARLPAVPHYLTAVVEGEVPAEDDRLLLATTAAVGAAVAAGALRADPAPSELAAALVAAVLRRARSHPADRPDGVVDHVWRRHVLGVAPRAGAAA